jgi:predicted transcriptional regulator
MTLLIICLLNGNNPLTTGEESESRWIAKTADWKPDGSYALIGYSGGMIAKYNGNAFEYQFIYELDINQVSWNPNGTTALIVGSGGIIELNEIVFSLKLGKGLDFKCVDWNPNGTSALIGGQVEDENGELHASLLKYNGNELIDITWMLESDLDFSISHIAWSPVDNHALIFTDNQMLFEYIDNEISFLIEIENILDIEWNPDGSEVLFLDKSLSLKTWDLSKPFNLELLTKAKKDNIWHSGGLSIRPNGKEVLIFGYDQNDKLSKIYFYDGSLQLIEEFKNEFVYDIGWHPQEEYAIAIGSYQDSGGLIQRIDVIKKADVSNNLSPIFTVSFVSIITFIYIGLTETGRYKFFKYIFVPFLAKIRKRHPLENQMRDLIYKYIEHNPGENYSKIKKTLGLANGTLVYHLKILTKENLIKSITQGRRRRFYPIELEILDNNLIYEFDEPQMLTKIQKDILNKISEEPGISKIEMAKSIGVSRQLLNYHLNKLVKFGILKSKRKNEAENPS